MLITTANKFWLSLSPQDVLKGNVGITVMGAVPDIVSIKNSSQPFDAANNMVHPVLPKFKDRYLMVAIKSDNLGPFDAAGQSRYYYDNLRKGVESEYCNFYYDDNKYSMRLITSAHNEINDNSQVTLLSTLFANKKLHRILDIFITDIITSTSEPTSYNIKIRYLEDL